MLQNMTKLKGASIVGENKNEQLNKVAFADMIGGVHQEKLYINIPKLESLVGAMFGDSAEFLLGAYYSINDNPLYSVYTKAFSDELLREREQWFDELASKIRRVCSAESASQYIERILDAITRDISQCDIINMFLRDVITTLSIDDILQIEKNIEKTKGKK